MLTARQNMIETIRGGSPERFVNQFEAIELLSETPFFVRWRGNMRPGMGRATDAWGVTLEYREDQPGAFPVHDGEHIVLKDVTEWRSVIKAPELNFPEEDWAKCKAFVDSIDRAEKFAAVVHVTGVFGQLHYLMGMEDCMTNFYTEPEAMKELIGAITEWELEYARIHCERLKPDMVFHHDDWGSHRSTFLSPEMFDEFIFPSYKKIYGFYKANGVEVVVHHSDTYAATLVPHMIEMGIDVWQGCVDTNNIPALIQEYGGKISFMGALNNGIVDAPGWTEELISGTVEKACRECGKLYFIPCMTGGKASSFFPGVYSAVSREIDRMSAVMF